MPASSVSVLLSCSLMLVRLLLSVIDPMHLLRIVCVFFVCLLSSSFAWIPYVVDCCIAPVLACDPSFTLLLWHIWCFLCSFAGRNFVFVFIIPFLSYGYYLCFVLMLLSMSVSGMDYK